MKRKFIKVLIRTPDEYSDTDWIRHLGDLPNEAGFKFIGVLRSNTEVVCHVVKDANGCFTIKDGMFKLLSGWRKF